MPVSFLNPALLAGLLAAAVPIVVHLLGRRQAQRRRFAAIEFLLVSHKRLAARRRLRNLALLMARVALVAAAALAVARPLVQGATVAGAGQPVSAVAILDRTASMRTRIDGESAFARGRARLVAELEALPSGSEVAIVSLERRPQRLSDGFVRVDHAVRILERTEPGWSRGELGDAVAEAAVLLEGARRALRTLYVVSDLQAATCRSARAVPLEGAEVVVVDALGGDFPADVGLVAAELDATGETLTVEGIVGGAGDSRPGDVVARVRVAGELVNRAILQGSGRAVVALGEVEARGAELVVELAEGGALPANDRRWAYLDPPRPLRVLIADGAPSADIYRDEAFYLERALATSTPPISVEVRDALGGEVGALDDFDTVVLANVGALSSRARRSLARWVEDGGGLLVTAGDRATPDVLARTLGELLPGEPRSVVTRGAGELAPRLTPPRLEHPVLLPFDNENVNEGLLSARFQRRLAIEPAEDALVLLRFGDGMPALLEGRAGQGRVALLATSVDRDWSDLPVKPAYVPLVERLVRHLGGGLRVARRHDYEVGDRVEVGLDASVQEVPRWEAPDGAWIEPLAGAAENVAIEDVQRPGAYRAYEGEHRRLDLDFVVNVAAAESVLERASASQMGAALGVEVAVEEGSSLRSRREDEAAVPILMIVVLAFLAEAWLGGRSSVAEATS